MQQISLSQRFKYPLRKLLTSTGIGLALNLSCTIVLQADVVHMKNGEQHVGVVTEIYADRIVLRQSTQELNLLQNNIQEVVYDAIDQTYLSIGKKYFEAQKYDQALKYYDLALKQNPDSRAIQDAILQLRGIIFRQKDQQQQSHIDKQKELSSLGGFARRRAGQQLQGLKQDLDTDHLPLDIERSLGLRLVRKDDSFVVQTVQEHSPAANADILVGNKLYAIWGEAVKFKKLNDVLQELKGRAHTDVKITLEKKVVILRGSKFFFQSDFELIDARMEYVQEGLRVKSVEDEGRANLAGLRAGDFVSYVDGVSTKYMTMQQLKKKLRGPKSSRLELIVHRDLLLRRQ